jgi:N-acetylglucosamine kinase-like BadF-type ATPase
VTEYVIGVDIGGTKSHLALFDTEGNFVDFDRWGCLNHEGLPGSFTQFEDEFGQFVGRVLSRNKITMKDVVFSVLGVGGVDTVKQHTIISAILRKLGFERFILANDAFLGIPAGSETGTGICAINGTGDTLAGINKEGKMLQIGGVGAISSDMGGGAGLGKRLVSAVYRELFRKCEATLMTPLFFKELGITSKYDYVEKIYEKIDDGEFSLGAYNHMLFEAVKQGDAVAAGILREIAANYAGGISGMIEELRFPPDEELCVVLAGSVFVKGEHPFLIDSLKERVSGANPGRRVKFNVLDVPNVAGAVIWALNTHNGANVYRDKVCAQLREQGSSEKRI